MGLYRIISLILLSSLSLQAGSIVESIVARINDSIITYSEIVQEGELIHIENNVPMEMPLKGTLKKKILDLLIIREVLYRLSQKKNVSIDPDRFSERKKRYKNLPQIKKFLNKYSISDVEFTVLLKKRLLADTMTSRFLEKKFQGRDISPEKKKEAVASWYDLLKKRQNIVTYTIP